MRPLIVDALASGRGKRLATRDVIGAGPRAVAGILEERGLAPRLVQAEAFLRGDFDLGGFDLLLASGMTSDFRTVKRVIERWKAKSDSPAIVGGPVASEPERALLKTRADLCVIGEGELTLKELLKLGVEQGRLPDPESLDRICGIAHTDFKTVKLNRLRPVMKREIFNQFTPSTRIVSDYPLHRSARVYVEVLRGCSNYYRTRITLSEEGCVECRKCQDGKLEERYYCPMGVAPGCGYCSVPSLYGPPKSRSVEGIVDEVRGLLSIGVRRIVLSGPGFLDYGRDLLVEPKPLTDPRHPEPNYRAIEELLSSLKGIDRIIDGDASVMIENIKACLVTVKAAEVLGSYLKGTPVNIGFETGSREHASKLGRASTPEETIRALRRLKRAGLKPYVYFIHGLPGQTVETVDETLKSIDKSIRAGASRIILYRFQPLPMSAFHDQPKAPPAMRDSLSKRIYESAIRANEVLKQDLKGEKMKVIIADSYERDRRYHVAYPMPHGPVVLVDSGRSHVGELVEVEVVGVVSERMVRGRILDGMF